jgi:hypothetical protein
MGAGDALPDLEASFEIFRSIGDELSSAELLLRFATVAMVGGDSQRARELLETAREASERIGGHLQLEAYRLGILGQIELGEGHPDVALGLLDHAAGAAHSIGFAWWEGLMLSHASECAFLLGRLEETAELALRSLALGFAIEDGQATVYALGMLARVAAIEGDRARAGLLWGAVEQIEAAGWELGDWPDVREEYAAPIPFDDERFRERRSEGRVMALDDVVRVVSEGAASERGEKPGDYSGSIV